MLDSTVLLVSGDSTLIEACRESVRAIANLHLEVVRHVQEVRPSLKRHDVAVLLVHLMQERDTEEVIQLLRLIAATKQSIATLAIGEQIHAEPALTLLRAGAADFLSRPLDLRRLAYLVDTLTVRARYGGMRATSAQESAARGDTSEPVFCAHSLAMERLMEQVRVVAPQDTTLLLAGETGTGKTRLARLIHDLSLRHAEPFLVINCGALAANLIESEMFGHLKGAFTGADRDRSGKFADVGSGTLVLDEIDALPLDSQAKLLRAVEERVFEPVGSNKSLPVQARFIAASNRMLDQEVEAGRFRSDLYYRLNVVQFYLPPLRERPNMISPIIHGLIREFGAHSHRPVLGITPDALHVLHTYDWPGNIRELRNVIERAVALCPGPEIQLEDLPETVRSARAPIAGGHFNSYGCPPSSSTLGQTKKEAETTRILEALHKHGNNRLRAAAELGISRMTLYKKLHKYGLIGAA